MMPLSTLWSFDRTIDPATGHSPLADRIAANWVHDPGSVRHFRSSANVIYTLERDGREAYLRIAAASERSRPHIVAELDLLDRLHRAGIPVVRPLDSIRGETVVSQATEIGLVHAVLFDRLDGHQRQLEDLSLDDIARWGATVGRLHAAFAAVYPSGTNRVLDWQATLDTIDSGELPVPDTVRREAERLRGFVTQLPTTPAAYGLLHNDLELDNLVWDGDVAAVLDFDAYGNGWYGLDIAKALMDPLLEGDALDRGRIAAFLNGYRRHRSLDDKVVERLPDFLALARFRQYVALRRTLDIEEADAEAGASWLGDLIRRLNAWLEAYERGLGRVMT